MDTNKLPPDPHNTVRVTDANDGIKLQQVDTLRVGKDVFEEEYHNASAILRAVL